MGVGNYHPPTPHFSDGETEAWGGGLVACAVSQPVGDAMECRLGQPERQSNHLPTHFHWAGPPYSTVTEASGGRWWVLLG